MIRDIWTRNRFKFSSFWLGFRQLQNLIQFSSSSKISKIKSDFGLWFSFIFIYLYVKYRVFEFIIRIEHTFYSPFNLVFIILKLGEILSIIFAVDKSINEPNFSLTSSPKVGNKLSLIKRTILNMRMATARTGLNLSLAVRTALILSLTARTGQSLFFFCLLTPYQCWQTSA